MGSCLIVLNIILKLQIHPWLPGGKYKCIPCSELLQFSSYESHESPDIGDDDTHGSDSDLSPEEVDPYESARHTDRRKKKDNRDKDIIDPYEDTRQSRRNKQMDHTDRNIDSYGSNMNPYEMEWGRRSRTDQVSRRNRKKERGNRNRKRKRKQRRRDRERGENKKQDQKRDRDRKKKKRRKGNKKDRDGN